MHLPETRNPMDVEFNKNEDHFKQLCDRLKHKEGEVVGVNDVRPERSFPDTGR